MNGMEPVGPGSEMQKNVIFARKSQRAHQFFIKNKLFENNNQGY